MAAALLTGKIFHLKLQYFENDSYNKFEKQEHRITLVY